MNQEIERKFLLQENGESFAAPILTQQFPDQTTLRDIVLRNGEKIRQGYLPLEQGLEIANIIGVPVNFTATEARLRDRAGTYTLTLKSSGDLTRHETPEAEVSKTIFELYWPYAKRRIEKVRLVQDIAGNNVEIDAYMGRNLITAEIEVDSEEEASALPLLGLDVTTNPYYKNNYLAGFPNEKKIILTGGPCCGKSAVIDYLQSLQYVTIPESARIVIEEEQERGGDIVPWEKLLEFQLEVLHRSMRAEEALEEWGTTFLDRGIPDGVAYCARSGVEPPTPLRDAVRSRHYKSVLVLDPIPYQNDESRKEDEVEAKRIHDQLIKTYRGLGLNPVSIPVDLSLPKEESIRKRAHTILEEAYKIR